METGYQSSQETDETRQRPVLKHPENPKKGKTGLWVGDGSETSKTAIVAERKARKRLA
jgi:hypothetical protein